MGRDRDDNDTPLNSASGSRSGEPEGRERARASVNTPFAALRALRDKLPAASKKRSTRATRSATRTKAAAATSAPRASEGQPAASSTPRANEQRAAHDNDSALFTRAVGGVRPLGGRDNFVGHRRPTPAPRLVDEEAEVVAELDALVSGTARFDLTWSDEHIEGIAHGVDRKLLRKLRRGDYSVRRHLDLHGLTRKEAKPEVAAFLTKARADGHRCVLVVHGRGLNSKDRIPVLKEALAVWLTRGRIGQLVLGFASARPTDGGLGAVYVLLRR